MVDFKKGIIAIIGFVFGIMITVFGWYLVGALSDIIPVTSLKTIFWIGAILFWISAVVISPLLMILGGKPNFKGCIFGLVAFISGYVLSLIIYYTVGYLLEAMESIESSATFLTIGWFAVYTIWILGLIIAPLFLVVKDALKKGEGAEEDGW